MNEFHLPHFADLSYLNIAYALVAMCVVYKLAFIARQCAAMGGHVALMMRMSCLVVGSILIIKAYGRIQGGDEAQILDVLRELSWCVFLATSITILRGRLGHW